VLRAEESLAALGCPKVNLQVMTSNAAVVVFYERLGYGVEERISMGRRDARISLRIKHGRKSWP
jgi:ribosomal protein S18 acetylase RimI-like enzyme